MYYTEDEHLALALHNDLNSVQASTSKTMEVDNLNPTDPRLEYIDPTPSIYDLFVKFDRKYFGGSLGMVEVAWSNKMTTCAGICYFKNAAGCKITLSAPLLSLRPRKDLVETLLHEMIHAYLFFTAKFRDRNDHGYEFHQHMFRINRQAGTNITVYHTFHDEVHYLKKHIWRCNGPCQYKKPYFGLFSRAINRPPGPSEYWWNSHTVGCGGTFIKIVNPEKKPKKHSKTQKNKSEKQIKKETDALMAFKEYSMLHSSKQNVATVDLTFEKSARYSETGVVKDKDILIKSDKTVNLLFLDTSGKRKKPGTSETPADFVRKVWANKFPDKTRSQVSNPETSSLVNNSETLSQVSNPETRSQDGDPERQSQGSDSEVYSSLLDTGEKKDPNKIVRCIWCFQRFVYAKLNDHINKCLIANHVEDSSEEIKECPVCSLNIPNSDMADHLENCVMCRYGNPEEKDSEVSCLSYPCPCCHVWVLGSEMGAHIESCLRNIS